MKLALAVRPAVAKLIRLLASDVDGEALSAVRALGRALKANGCDFHDLAGLVEAPSTSARSGRAEADFRNHFGGDDDGETELPWQLMVDACTNQLGRFTSKERQFLQTMQRWHGTPTLKQLNWLVALFERVREAA
jgi:hypothetical protein